MVEHSKNYAWNADSFAKHSSSQYKWTKQLIPKLKLSGNEALLDIGCGDGKVTAVLAKSLPRGCVVGIDSSEDMVTLARQTFPQETYPNLAFQKMDARALTFQEKFDRILKRSTALDYRPAVSSPRRPAKPEKRRQTAFSDGRKGQRSSHSLSPRRDAPR